MSDSLWQYGLQHIGFPVLHHLLELAQTHVHWVSDAIQPSHPLSSPSPPALHTPSFLASGSFLISWFCISGGQSIEASTSVSVLAGEFKVNFLQDWLLWSPYGPRDSQESSATPQFKSVNSSVLSFLYHPTLTSIYDYWKNHGFD